MLIVYSVGHFHAVFPCFHAASLWRVQTYATYGFQPDVITISRDTLNIPWNLRRDTSVVEVRM